MENLPDITSENNDSRDRLNNTIAVLVAILAAFMAVTKVKDDNIVQAMLQDKSDAVDTWSEYQSKKIKQHVLELGRDQSQVLRTAQNSAQVDEQLKHYESELDRYTNEAKDLMTKAKGLEAQYDTLNHRDDQFDLSDAALSVSLAMLAVTALTRKRWLLWASLIFAGFGVIMGLGGLLNLQWLHPDWLSSMLS